MQLGGQNATIKKLEPAVEFLRTSVALGIPANTIVFIDTHSDANTGSLQYAGGQTNAKTIGANIVFDFFGSVRPEYHKPLTESFSCWIPFSDRIS
jgi:hypothetical protein